jgi:hypothetical protein
VHHKVTAIKLFQYPCRISKNPVTEGFPRKDDEEIGRWGDRESRSNPESKKVVAGFSLR